MKYYESAELAKLAGVSAAEVRRLVRAGRLAPSASTSRGALFTEAEVSAAICFLLCEAAAFVTGTCLQVDGGAPLWSALFPSPPHGRSDAFQGFHRAVPPDSLAGTEG